MRASSAAQVEVGDAGRLPAEPDRAEKPTTAHHNRRNKSIHLFVAGVPLIPVSP